MHNFRTRHAVPTLLAVLTAIPAVLPAAEVELGKSYSLSAPAPLPAIREAGKFSCSLEPDFLVVEFAFVDSEVLALGQQDQLEHHILGDLAEIFILPPDRKQYWEFFATPKGKQTCYHYERKADGTSYQLYATGDVLIDVAIEITGNGWSGKVRIPLRKLEKNEPAFTVDGSWKMLVARQNYTGKVDKEHRELSSYPQVSKVNFHLHSEYAAIKDGNAKK